MPMIQEAHVGVGIAGMEGMQVGKKGGREGEREGRSEGGRGQSTELNQIRVLR